MVNRVYVSFPIDDLRKMKLKMLNWTNRFNIFCLLDNHEYASPYPIHECLVAAGCIENITADPGNSFDTIKHFAKEHNDWLFGHFSYDLKSETEEIPASHSGRIGFPGLFFFIPEWTLELGNASLRIGSINNDHQSVFDELMQTEILSGKPAEREITIRSALSREEYLLTIQALRGHILRGDCYEINFCQEFFAEEVSLNPAQAYRLLSETSPTPFACYYRVDDQYLMCASPERYLSRHGSRLISQPVKGTWQRNTADQVADEQYKTDLYHSAKDRSENVMIVDLVRNDLSKICLEGTVQVDELFGIYTFPQVHQMISTISGEQQPGLDWTDLVRATFPMGSMTGAPKKRVMELISEFEKSDRGLFSGAVGYVKPDGDFDFNVVIRSIFYDATRRYLSYRAGSGITFYSDAEKEFEECMLKVAAIKKVLAV